MRMREGRYLFMCKRGKEFELSYWVLFCTGISLGLIGVYWINLGGEERCYCY